MMTYKDRLRGPQEFLEMFMLYESRVILGNCCNRKKCKSSLKLHIFYFLPTPQILGWQAGWNPCVYRHLLHAVQFYLL